MAQVVDLSFDFDFGTDSSQTFFNEARQTITTLEGELGSGKDIKGVKAAEQATLNLLDEFEHHVAELHDPPQMINLKAKDFKLYGWDTPKQFTQWSKTHRFYWMKVPVYLSQLQNMPFSKLELGIEFNPGSPQDHRPLAVMIFPNKAIKQIAHFEQGASLKVGEDFQLELATPTIDLQAGQAKAKAKAGVSSGAKGGFDVSLGPFSYDLRTLELEHSDPDSSKVTWKIFSAKYLNGEHPDFIVVLKVPLAVNKIIVAEAMQAYHQFDVGAAGLGQVIRFISDKARTFFEKGAPIRSKAVFELDV